MARDHRFYEQSVSGWTHEWADGDAPSNEPTVDDGEAADTEYHRVMNEECDAVFALWEWERGETMRDAALAACRDTDAPPF